VIPLGDGCVKIKQKCQSRNHANAKKMNGLENDYAVSRIIIIWNKDVLTEGAG
jgi:hypothetical protein